MIEVREVLRRFTLGSPAAKYIAAGVATGLCRGSTLPTDGQVPRSSRRSGRPTSGGRRRSLSG